MKKNLNKKGFTLIELLAVIVVLAIVMAIATQQVSRIIAKSRAEAMLKTMELAKGAVKNKITLSEDPTDCSASTQCLSDVLDYDPKNYEIIVELMEGKEYNIDKTDPNYKITIKAKDGGDFALANFNFVKNYKDDEQIDGKNDPAKFTGKVSAEKTYVKIDKKHINSEKKDDMPTIFCYIDRETGVVEFDSEKTVSQVESATE